MSRFLLTFWGWLCLSITMCAAQGLPPRPVPFTFVSDQAQLLAPADAQKLEGGLRRYADNTGTQVVVVTVPSLQGRPVADYARAIGTEWGVGQRDKDNGVVVLIGKQERQVSIQAGSGLRELITPAVTNSIINQQMTPRFKQGNYFAGLRAGLNTLLLAAHPDSDPRHTAPAGTPATSAGSDNFPALDGAAPAADNAATTTYDDPSTTEPTRSAPAYDPAATAEPQPSGPGIGTLLLGLVAVVGIGWLLLKLFRRRSAAPAASAPSGPDFFGTGNQGGGRGYGGPVNQGSSGPGLGGMLATGAAAAAGAYLGNRMASGHDTSSQRFDDGEATRAAGLGAPSYGSPAPESGPDYFSDTDNTSADYFSNDSSNDDSSSDNTGGGGFDDNNDNSGSW